MLPAAIEFYLGQIAIDHRWQDCTAEFFYSQYHGSFFRTTQPFLFQWSQQMINQAGQSLLQIAAKRLAKVFLFLQ